MKRFYPSLTLFTLCLFRIYTVQAQEFAEDVAKFIAVNDSIVAIINLTVIDGTGGPVRSDQTVVIVGDHIAEIGDSQSMAVPPGATLIDGTGKTAIPGLVMLHEHLYYAKSFEDWFSVDQMTFTFPRLYLAGGVTTMRTGGSIQPQTDLNVKRWIDEGKMTGPKMDVTSPYIEREGYEIPELGFINDIDEVAELVNYWAGKGVTSFKVYNHITREDLRTCIREAHERGLKVTGHLCSITYAEASDMGIDNLEHGFMVSSDFVDNKKPDFCDPFEARAALAVTPQDSPAMDSLISLLVRNGTAITSTPVVFEPYTGHEIVPGGGIQALAGQVQASVINTYQHRVGRDSASIELFNKNMHWLKAFHERGGLLVAGSDPTGAGRTVAGYANQRIVEILVETGFTLMDAIKICTLNGAIYLERDQKIGTLEEGKKADLLLINGDLQEDIMNIRRMEIVFKDGVGFDSQKLFESVRGMVGLY